MTAISHVRYSRLLYKSQTTRKYVQALYQLIVLRNATQVLGDGTSGLHKSKYYEKLVAAIGN